ncbi:MAG TPA: toll/interleukin-1 receptor domain-containing protein [Pseudomonadales bacterium]|nr:toll/interleukin-1 receptor domain-containing protein [Pseudomonadales bacterium]
MYKAFISYSHRDSQWAKWLHSQLERYRLPRHLAQSLGQPAKIGKIFRDRDELSSGQDLAAHIQTALQHSEYLLVICSPDATQSQWVNAEIEYFQKLGKHKQIFCLLVEGGDDAFPRALRTDDQGNGVTPLAADPRDSADGQHLAKLKIIAGMFGIALDTLVQRDRQRRKQQRLASAIGMAGIIGLGLYAYINAIERQYQQLQAEKLASFVLDLGGKLRNRIDIASQIAINQEGLNYLQQFDVASLSEASRARIAMAYRQLGLAQQAQQLIATEDLITSLDMFTALAEQHPDAYLFEKGQAAFYVGADYFYRDEHDMAAKYFTPYVDISKQLFEKESDNTLFQSELLNAVSTLLALELERDPRSSVIQKLVNDTQQLVQSIGNIKSNLDTYMALANAKEWLGEYYEKNARQEDYFGAVYDSLVIREKALALDPNNLEISELILNNEFKLGMIVEDPIAKKNYFEKALYRVKRLRVIDSENAFWQEYEARLTAELAKF